MKRFELERAISENELTLHYQPMVEVATRRLTGVEALVRWRHPERGLVSPLEFIPEAEATGLIRRLTFWVLREALLQSNVWRRDEPTLRMAPTHERLGAGEPAAWHLDYRLIMKDKLVLADRALQLEALHS